MLPKVLRVLRQFYIIFGPIENTICGYFHITSRFKNYIRCICYWIRKYYYNNSTTVEYITTVENITTVVLHFKIEKSFFIPWNSCLCGQNASHSHSICKYHTVQLLCSHHILMDGRTLPNLWHFVNLVSSIPLHQTCQNMTHTPNSHKIFPFIALSSDKCGCGCERAAERDRV